MLRTSGSAYLNMSFVVALLTSNVVSWSIAARLASCFTLVSACWWGACVSMEASNETIAMVLHIAVFHSYSFVLMVCAYLRRPLLFLTTWSYALHVMYFHNFDISNPGTDLIVLLVHPLSFIAAFFVFIGFFFVNNVYGGGVPSDLIPNHANSQVSFSALIGWLHACPVWCHIVDSCLNAANFQRVYSGYGRSWLLVFGICGFFALGQCYQLLIPSDTVETYQAPKKVWYGFAHRVARKLGLGSEELLRGRRATVFSLGEDFVFSWAVKLPGTVGAVIAIFMFQWYILDVR